MSRQAELQKGKARKKITGLTIHNPRQSRAEQEDYVPVRMGVGGEHLTRVLKPSRCSPKGPMPCDISVTPFRSLLDEYYGQQSLKAGLSWIGFSKARYEMAGEGVLAPLPASKGVP
jgi:hypothetical protein